MPFGRRDLVASGACLQPPMAQRSVFREVAKRAARGTAMNAIIDFLNTIFWGYVLIYGLLAVGRVLHDPAALPADPAFRRDVPGHYQRARHRQGRDLAVPGALHLAGEPGRHRQHRRGRGGAESRRPGSDLLDVDGRARRHGDGLFGVDARPALQGARQGGPDRHLPRRPGLLHRQGPRDAVGGGDLLGLPDPVLRSRVQRGAGEFDRRRHGRSLRHPEARNRPRAGGADGGGDLRRHPQDRAGRRVRGAVHGRRLPAGGVDRPRR